MRTKIDNKLVFIIIVLVIILGIFLVIKGVPRAEANPSECRGLHAECQINNQDDSCCAGTVCTDFNEHSGNGKCEVVSTPTPTLGEEPTATPTEEVQPSVTPTPTISEGCVEDCQSPTPTPTSEELQPTVVVTNNGFTDTTPHFTDSGTPICSNEIPTMVQDIWYSDYKVTGNTASLILHWGLNPQYGKAVIAYGLKIGEWLYGVPEVDNNGSFSINGLKPNTTYWFQVAYKSGCAVGNFSHPQDP